MICDMEAEDDLGRLRRGRRRDRVRRGSGPWSGPAATHGRPRRGGQADRRREAIGIDRYVMVSAIGASAPERSSEAMRPYYDAKARGGQGARRERARLTIVRPGSLTNDSGTGHVRAGQDIGSGSISRDDVAATVAAVLAAPNTIGVSFDLLGATSPSRTRWRHFERAQGGGGSAPAALGPRGLRHDLRRPVARGAAFRRQCARSCHDPDVPWRALCAPTHARAGRAPAPPARGRGGALPRRASGHAGGVDAAPRLAALRSSGRSAGRRACGATPCWGCCRHPARALHALAAEHDQVRALAYSHVHDRVCRVSLGRVAPDLEALLAQVRDRSREDGVHLEVRADRVLARGAFRRRPGRAWAYRR